MIRVAHLIRPAAGGMRRHFLLLLKTLSNTYRLTAYIPHDDCLSRELEEAGIDFEIIPFPSRGTIWSYYRLSSYLKEKWSRENFSLFHFHGYRAAVVGSLAIRGLGKNKAIATIHNFPPKGYLNKFLFIIARRIITSSCQHLIFVSRAVKEAWKLEKDRVVSSVIYNGVSEDFFEDEIFSGPPRDRGEKKVQIAYLGRLSREKGADIFLRAISLIKDAPDLKFLIVGEGEEKASLTKLALSLGLEKVVEFLDFQPDLKSLLKSVDVVVIPSRQEAFSLLAVEALALGKPVIASKVGGLPEALGRFGYFFPQGDHRALAEKIKEVASKVSIFPAEEARKWVQKNFPLSKMVNQVEQVYREVIKSDV